MSQIEIEKIIDPIPASDGAGVKLKRSIGTHLIDYHDPFLMLDEFGSDNKAVSYTHLTLPTTGSV